MSKLDEMKELMSGTKRPGKFDLPTEGRISLSQIGEEVLGLAPGRRVSLEACRAAAGFPGTKVAFSDFYGYTACDGLNYKMTVGDSGLLVGYSNGYLGNTFGSMDCDDYQGGEVWALYCQESTPGVATSVEMILRNGATPSPFIRIQPVPDISGGFFIVHRVTDTFYNMPNASECNRFLAWIDANVNRSFQLTPDTLKTGDDKYTPDPVTEINNKEAEDGL